MGLATPLRAFSYFVEPENRFQYTRAVRRATHFRIHNFVGLVVAAFAVVVGLTGILLTFRGSFRQPRPVAPVVERHLPLMELIGRAEVEGGAEVTDITLPQEDEAPYVMWVDDDEGSMIFLAGDGSLLEKRPEGNPITGFIFQLHTGAIAGRPGELWMALVGMGFVALSVTGVAMWWSRRRPKRKMAPPRGAAKPTPAQASRAVREAESEADGGTAAA